MAADVPTRYRGSKYVEGLKKKEVSATRRASTYRKKWEKSESLAGSVLPVQAGAALGGALQSMFADVNGQVMGIDFPLVAGVAGIAIGTVADMPMIVKMANGPLAAWMYQFGGSLTAPVESVVEESI